MARKPPAIVSLDESPETHNFMIYADSGAGKTVLGASHPDVLILNAEAGGTISAKKMGLKADVWPINHWQDLQDAYAYLKNEDHPYRWATLDSATELQAKAKGFILERALDRKPDHAPDNLELQDWVPYYELWKKTVRAFNNLDVNVLWTALPAKHENEEGDAIVLPDIEGKGYSIAQWTCAQMTVVGHLRVLKKKDKDGKVIGDKRRINWRTVPPYFGKDRLNMLGRFSEDISLAEIDAIISGKAEEEEPEKARPKATRRKAKPEPEPEPEPEQDNDDDIDLDDEE